MVSLPQLKKAKYLMVILEWNLTSTHYLAQMQKLYGKLLHAWHIVPKDNTFLLSPPCALI